MTYKPKAISGFPEWLPEYRAVELDWLDKIRRVFESYGFCNIETPIVEEVDALLAAKGGDTQNEIYVLERLYAEKDSDKEARLALHFDLTVPMARYVAQNFNSLVFPFKRYQMQKSYRGERPQKGRYREFTQCDLDIVNIDGLPLQCDVDVTAALMSAYETIDIPPVEIHISNRKILIGFLRGVLKLDDEFSKIITILDKIDKLGINATKSALLAAAINSPLDNRYAAMDAETLILAGQEKFDEVEPKVNKCLELVNIKTTDTSFVKKIRDILGDDTDPLLEEGISELNFVMEQLGGADKNIIANLGIIRGLDYYTGTVIEARFKDTKVFGDLSIGGGGRYENLASAFINQKLPGVGVSLGLTRLFGLLLDKGLIAPGRKSPTDILVVLPEEGRRAEAAATANTLRGRGFNVELYHTDGKVKKQLSYAEKKNIPFVWFPPFKDGQPHEVKDMATGEQTAAAPATWEKPA